MQMKAGKLNLQNTTVTADPRKGLLVLRKSEDGLMHLIWKDRNASTAEDDLIVFEGDATIRRLDECKDGFAMLLEFSQTARKLFFYSQEPRKKDLGWADAADVKKETELLDKAQIVCATLSGAGSDLLQKSGSSFDAVIVDEAAQALEPAALIPLQLHSERCILVGDPQQLPATVWHHTV